MADGRQYVVGMDRLTPEHARQVHDAIGPTRGYLARLIPRMEHVGLRGGDPKLYALVRAAEDAMHSLCVELHYQSCGHGVGRPPSE
jgi:hypothetical protein